MKQGGDFVNNTFNNRKIILLSVRLFIFLAIYLAIGLIFSCLSSLDFRSFINTNASNIDIKSAPIVIIDPGHGGIDGGAVSESGVIEKEINLKIADNIRDLFSMSGIKCILTRETDIELVPQNGAGSSRKRSDLLARIEIGNSYDNAIFISIHQNKYPSSRLTGMQVFYSKNNPDSRTLAQCVKSANFSLIDTGNKREIKPAGREILILDNLEIPAVLVECGFLSNATEAKKLSDASYRKKLAFMIYRAIYDYLETKNT